MRSASRIGFAVLLSLAVDAIVIAFGAAPFPSQAPPPQQPIFRAGANFVPVDVYPRRAGRIVLDLTVNDFEILEDGKPQAIESLRFYRVDPLTSDAARRDPNNVRESLELVADPANRVFVLYLDTNHVTITGSHDVKQPLINMLDRMLAPNDLFGVLTPKLPASAIAFGRKTLTTSDEVTKYWAWGDRDTLRMEEEDYAFVGCYGYDQHGNRVMVDDDGQSRWFPDVLKDRRREDATLTRLEELVTYLRRVREERKSVVLFTDGWLLYEPREDYKRIGSGLLLPDAPPLKFEGGKLGIATGATDYGSQFCSRELTRLANLRDHDRLRDLMADANRANVTFYPVSTAGLAVFDTSLREAPGPLMRDMNHVRGRVDALQTLAVNTDGIAVVNTNDLNKGIEHIVDDLSAYYVLGYYSTNTRFDGAYRRITVRMKQPGVTVVGRRGYTAPRESDLHPPAVAPTSVSSVVGAPAVDVERAFAPLARLRPNADAFSYGVASGGDLVVALELSSAQMATGRWAQGGEVIASVVNAAGDTAGSARAQMAAGARGVLMRIPITVPTAGPWQVRLRVRNDAGTLDEVVPIAVPVASTLADPMLYRASSASQSAWTPAASFQFRRTERVRLEWTANGAIDSRQARLLDRTGHVLPIDVVLTETPEGTPHRLTGEVSLGALAPGDYLIEVTTTSAGKTEKKLVAIRVGA